MQARGRTDSAEPGTKRDTYLLHGDDALHRAGVATEHDKVLPADPGEEIHSTRHVLDETGRFDVMNSDLPGKPVSSELIGPAPGWTCPMEMGGRNAAQRVDGVEWWYFK